MLALLEYRVTASLISFFHDIRLTFILKQMCCSCAIKSSFTLCGKFEIKCMSKTELSLNGLIIYSLELFRRPCTPPWISKET